MPPQADDDATGSNRRPSKVTVAAPLVTSTNPWMIDSAARPLVVPGTPALTPRMVRFFPIVASPVNVPFTMRIVSSAVAASTADWSVVNAELGPTTRNLPPSAANSRISVFVSVSTLAGENPALLVTVTLEAPYTIV